MRKRVVIVDEKFSFAEETKLTVHKTSLFFEGDGFIAYAPTGDLLFRFDSYGPDSQPKDQLLLLDASGTCLLTLLRKAC
ncbi:protein LURP-one-related 5-like [Senna tora]|uniref:Protein LURP-one-related 5-like n=1 Tax=Senna tora TaxID=362788 RepID=A0A834SLA1_9FABA|nr:protein LURP-one-related 5-like [Senna tora]